MQSLRKLSMQISKEEKIVGILIEICIFIRLLLWDGSAQLTIFFRERVPSKFRAYWYFQMVSKCMYGQDFIFLAVTA